MRRLMHFLPGTAASDRPGPGEVGSRRSARRAPRAFRPDGSEQLEPKQLLSANISVFDAPYTDEGNSGSHLVYFTVSVAAHARPVSVAYSTSDGTAHAGSDYEATSGRLAFEFGEYSKRIPVKIYGDTTEEPDERFAMNLSAPSGDAIIDRGQAWATILNDDQARASISINDVKVTEGDSGTTDATFTVTLLAPSSQPVTVRWATADGTATTADNDFRSGSGTLTFNHDETSKTISIPVIGDTKFEPNDPETLFVILSNPSSNATIVRGQGTGRIINDDPAMLVTEAVLGDGSRGRLYSDGSLWRFDGTVYNLLDTGVISFRAASSGKAGNGDPIALQRDGFLIDFPRNASGGYDRGTWQWIDQLVSSFAVAGNGDPIALQRDGFLIDFPRNASGGYDRGTWQWIDQLVSSFAVAGNGDPIALQRDGFLIDFPRNASGGYDRGTWQWIDQLVSSFAVAGNGDPIALQRDGFLIDFPRNASGGYDRGTWQWIDQLVSSFAVAGNGDPIAQERTGALVDFPRNASGGYDKGTWKLLDAAAASFAIAGNGDVIELQTNGRLIDYPRNASGGYDGGTSKILDGAVTSLTIADNGDPIALEPTGQRKQFLRTASGDYDANTYKILNP